MVLVLNKNPRAWYFYKQKKRITHHGFPLSLLNKKSTLYGLKEPFAKLKHAKIFENSIFAKLKSFKNDFLGKFGRIR